jgi:hypothetical protein
MHVMAVHVRANLKMLEQFATSSGVLGQNQISFFEDANRSKRHVFEVANWSGYDI